MKVIDYKKFQVSRVVYDKPVKCKGGCLLTKTKYNIDNNQIPIYIQTPKLRTTSGLVISDSRSYIDLELDKNHLGFYEFITNLDENNLTTTHENSNEWFGQDLPMDVIDDFYNSPLKMSKLEKAPSVKFKVPVSKGRPLCEIFGDHSISLDYNLIKKDTEVVCILQLVGVKFFKQRFECDWQVIQMKAFLQDYIPKACLIDDSLMTDFEKDPEIFTLNTNGETTKVESPTDDTPVIEALENENSLVETPTVDTPVVETPTVDTPVVETPTVDTSIVESLEGETSLVEAPTVDTHLEENENTELELRDNSLVVEDLNLSDSDLDEQSDDVLSESEIDLEDDDEEFENEISDLDDNVEEIYLDDCENSEEESEEEDEIDDLDLEEIELEKGNEVQNLMNEIEELKKIALEKDEEVKKLKTIGQTLS